VVCIFATIDVANFHFDFGNNCSICRMEIQMKQGIFKEHQECGRLDYLSNSKMSYLLDSRKSFFQKYILQTQEPFSKAMDLGKLIHLAVLKSNEFSKAFKVMPDFGDLRSSANRTKRDSWKMEQGPDVVVVTAEDYEKIVYCVESILEHDVARALLTNGLSERKVYFRDFETWLMGNPDFLFDQDSGGIPRGTVAELKTTSYSVNPASFAKQIADHEYYRQLALYMHMVGGVLEIPENRRGAWVAVETVPPYTTAVYTPSDNMIKAGMIKIKKACEIFNEMKKVDPEFKNKKLWIGYQKPTDADEIDLPYWFYKNDLDFMDITQIQMP
jgi:hypothetical protein